MDDSRVKGSMLDDLIDDPSLHRAADTAVRPTPSGSHGGGDERTAGTRWGRPFR
jgi:hypothetical protein